MTLIFDFGGVVTDSSNESALRAFASLGLQHPEQWLDRYCQKGPFQQLEQGQVSDEQFVRWLSGEVGRPLSWSEVQKAWRAFMTDVPQAKLHALDRLHRHHRLLLLSNTNPFVMRWARSTAFTSAGRPLDDYFDGLYLSYEMGVCKPDERIFTMLLEQERLKAADAIFIDDSERNIQAAERLGFHVLCPKDNVAWETPLLQLIQQLA